MTNTPTSLTRPAYDRAFFQRLKHWSFPLAALRRWLVRLRWLVPASLVMLVVAYEVGPASWIYASLGYRFHLLAEILLFGTVGPALAFILLDLLGRWLEECETSDLQTQILAQARERIQNSRQLNDDALQALFAAGILVASLQSGRAEFPREMVTRLEETERALHQAIERLRTSLLD